MAEISFREAIVGDADRIAEMNQQLIRDEGHRNPMSLLELTDRMRVWLQGDYEAVVIHDNQAVIGYALFRRDPEHIYLRQFFVEPDRRREGIGRAAIAWMWNNVWADAVRLRLDVLVGNSTGRAFWHAMGFSEYCITLEAERQVGKIETTEA
ncbi:MAG: GNAT family N-acetyltransferase [Planctomycetales bacterium]|nr:GNAT family N-acetyltransferase [Planctomycetales bacterium]